jgi:LysM repeat protein
MINRRTSSYFDASTLIALALAAFLLVSLPGGCGDSDDAEREDEVSTETVAEPTAPALMEIVDPEPGDLNTETPAEPDEQAEPPDENQDAEPEPENGTPDGIYVVQPGDTLYDIAVRFSVSMDALMEINGMANPDQLQVGQELQIPD